MDSTYALYQYYKVGSMYYSTFILTKVQDSKKEGGRGCHPEPTISISLLTTQAHNVRTPVAVFS